MLTRNDRQEALSRAYVRAIAALAGVICSAPEKDYGIDLCLRSVRVKGRQRTDGGEQFDLQLKSTSQAMFDETQVSFDLDARTYKHLREPTDVPRILVLFVVPEDETQWLTQTVDEMIVRRCAWWVSLEGMEPTTASRSVRIAIPLSNVFSKQAVLDLFDAIRERNAP